MRRASTLLSLLVVASLAAPAAASAHATLLRTIPANGTAVAHAPRAVRVEFDDTVRVGPANAAVANATNASVLAGPARAHGRELTIPLRPRLGTGAYSVRWSIVSDDGHHEEGVLAFAVGAVGGVPRAVLAATTGLGWWTVGFRIAFYLGMLCAAGTAVFGLRTRDLGAPLRRPVARLLFFSLLLAFLGDSGVVDAAPGGTRNALVLRVALGIALAGATAAALAPLAEPLLLVAGACAVALLATPTLSGHALDHNQPWALSIPADIVHTAAAAAWLGGLVALLTVVPRAGLDTAQRAEAIRRVSRTALGAVPLLAAAGLLRAATELNAVDQAWSTTYGRALLVKTAVFVPLVTLGWLNRTRLIDVLGALRRSVRIEVALIAVVVGAVAVLVQLRPGRESSPPAAAAAVPRPPVLPPRDAVVEAREDGTLAVAVARGPRATTITLVTQDGTGASGRRVLVDGAPTLPCGPGCYRGPARAGLLRVAVDGRLLTFAVVPEARPAAALLARATTAYRRSRTIVFDESLRSGPTGGIVTRFTLAAPDRLGYVIRGGPQAVVIGTRRWDRDTPNGRWVESQQTPLRVTRPYWRQPTNVHLVAPRTLTFLDRAIPAWFRLTLDARGRPLELHMTAAAHFMIDRYVGYDVPVELSPPSR